MYNFAGKTFTATIDPETTRTTLTNDFKVEWTAGDDVCINDSWYKVSPNDPATSAVLSYIGGSDVGVAPYKAIYPEQLYNVFYKTYSFPTEQIYTPGRFNAPMYAESDTESLSFKNICGVVCFALKGTDKILNIAIHANEPICGEFTVTDGTTVNLSGDGKSITLNCGDGVQLNPDTATKFYIYLPPKEYSAGMTFIFNAPEGDSYIKTTTKDITVERGNVYTFNMAPVFTKKYPDGVLPGVFSVSDDTKVSFSTGILIYDNGSFKLENNQYFASDGRWKASRLDSFFWSKDATVAEAKEYDDPNAATSDVLFTNALIDTPNPNFTVLGKKGVFRALTETEWYYMIHWRENASRLVKANVNVCGHPSCIIIAPDNYTGTIQDSYSYQEWQNAENSGLVCIPYSTKLMNSGSWLSSSDPSNTKYAFSTDFTWSITYSYSFRNSRNAIRLVKNAY